MADLALHVQVETLSGGAFDNATVNQLLTDAARLVADLLPKEKAEQYGTATTTLPADVKGKRVIAAYCGPHEARHVSPDIGAHASDVNSIYYAVEHDPIYFVKGSTLTILPAGVDDSKVYTITYPSVDGSAAVVSSEWPTQLTPLVVYRAASTGLLQLIGQVQALILSTTSDLKAIRDKIAEGLDTDEDIELGQAQIVRYTAELERYRRAAEQQQAQLASIESSWMLMVRLTLGIEPPGGAQRKGQG